MARYAVTIAGCLGAGLGAGAALRGTGLPGWVLVPVAGLLLLRASKRGKRPDGWSACGWERAHPVASAATTGAVILVAGAVGTLLLPAHERHSSIRFTLLYGVGSSVLMCCVLLGLQARRARRRG